MKRANLLDLLCPRLFLSRVEEIRLEELRRQGYSALIFDLDNTLVSWKSWRPSPSVVAWLKKAHELGFKMCIVSNCLLRARVRRFSRLLDIPAIPKGGKPRPHGFLQAVEMMQASIERTIVIGDQLFTDVLGGNRVGCFTILVRPIDSNEFLATILTRTLERIALFRLRRTGRLRELEVWPSEPLSVAS
ncbi:MAG: YqeG family HAD IIIA-type phosphatase [Candidatus Xenobia bacterium]